MATKFLTGGWEGDETDNQQKRDDRRKTFWEELGVTPARDTAEIDIPVADRMALYQSLVQQTVSGPVDNAQMRAITLVAAQAIGGMTLGSLDPGVPSMAFSWNELLPIEMKKFFMQWHVTAFEASKMGGE
ncbi:hypothetical protein HGP17_29200 [Rhizobium sp. P38BS-XIX]|uniref:hypothetical protein n=1 Tax=Rhizobium sp. P38BS-XIX TaxID=2726740 RepID=UPI001456E63B|nr:hypothetical protein [Rhizobium sp. P38BS-XIX]NLS00926.1 hypothetical protein [Rhizobium sp. P38BS-XIX]